MAELDPLRFAVELLDIEQSKIDAAWSKVERAFENRTLKVKIDGEKGAAQDSESLAVSLKEVSDNLKAIRQLLSQGGFKNLGDEAQKSASQMEVLAKSMQQVNDGMAKSEAWQNYIRTLEGAAAALKQVNDSASKTGSGDGGIRAQLASFAQAMKEVEVINQTIRKVESTRKLVGDGGYKSAELDGYLTRLREVRAELGKIVSGAGLHPTLTVPGTDTSMRTSDLLNLKFYQELQKKIQGTLKDIKAFRDSANKPTFQPSVDQTQNPTYIRNYEKATTALHDLQKAIRDVMEVRREAGRLKNEALFQSANAQLKALGQKYNEVFQLRKDIEKMQSGTALTRPLGADYKKLVGDDTKGLSRQMRDLERDTMSARKQIGELIAVWRQMQTLTATGKGNEQIRNLQEQIYNMVRAMSSGLRAGTPSLSLQAGSGGSGLVKRASDAMRSYEKSERDAAAAARQLAIEQDRLSRSMLQSADAALKQGHVLNDLKGMAMQYLSVYGAQQFLNNIIEIGGQLEMQRLSIAAILQDASMANELFGQVKALAVKSPFGVVQLDQDMKQLSAYGFQANELYDMTRRLADISAATGTDVSRLALALGHVRSEMALTGYTLRQFSMANVPMAKMLAEQLSEVEKRVVSVGEVRKRVRNKEIGYEEVEQVIKDLTNEGGMFYNMQEVMSESVKAKYKNLKDSLDIMYGEIAESSVGSASKKVAELLMGLTRNWEDLLAVLGTAGSMWVAMRGYSMLLNVAIKQQVLATKNVALANSKYTISQLRAMAAMRASTGMGKRLVGIYTALRAGALAAGSALKALWSALWPMLVIGAGVEMWMHWREQSEQAGEAASRAFDKASEGARHMKEALDSLPEWSTDMDSGAMHQGIERAVEAIRNYNPAMANDIIAHASETDDEGHNVMSLARQYKYLRYEVEQTKEMMEEYKRTSSAMGDALSNTGGFMNDNVYGDLKDYFDARKKWVTATNNFYSNDKRLVEESIKAAMSVDDAFREAAEGVEGYGERVRVLFENMNMQNGTGPFKAAYDKFRSVYVGQKGWSPSDWSGTNNQMYAKEQQEARRELDDWAEGYRKTMEGSFGYDFSKLSGVQIANVRQQIWDFVNSEELATLDDTMKKWVRDYLAQKWGITFSVEAEQALREVDEIKERLDAIVDGDWKIDIKGATNIEDVISKIQKGYKSAKEWIESAPPMLLKLGITSTDGAQLWSDDYIRQMANGDPIAMQILERTRDQALILNQALTANKQLGIPLETKKKTSKSKTEDPEAKRLREEVKLVKDAYDWWKKYRELMSDESALEVVQKRYAEFFKEAGVKVSLKDIPNYKGSLEKMLAEAEKLYGQKQHKNSYMADVIKELKKSIEQVDYDDLKKRGDDWASRLGHEVEELTRKFEIFQSVLDATGDDELAMRMASVSGNEAAAYTKGGSAEVVRQRLMVERPDIDFGKVLELDDEGIEKYVKELYGADEAIGGVVEQLKKWRDLQRDVVKSDIENYARTLSQLVDKESERVRLQREYNAALEETQRLLGQGLITPDEAARRDIAAQVTRETKGKENESWYTNLYSNSHAMAANEFAIAYRAELDNLDSQFESGIITLSQYVEKVGKLNEVAQGFSSRGFLGIHGGVGAFLSGGSQGLADYYQQRANKYRSEGNKEEADKYQSRADNLTKEQRAADQLVKAFEDVASAADLLGNLFDAMGMEGASNAMSDAGGILSGALGGASSLSALGPYGMAAGAALGIMGGIFQLHDKAIQREIDALQDNVDALEENTESIKQARERTLGYDRGELRRNMARQYSSGNRSIKIFGRSLDFNIDYGAAGVAMSEYYGKNSGRSGYAAELANLKAEREDYIKMYNLENDKKKKSQDSLDEYKSKIAELDDQIIHFTEDIAKELWSIDIKGWADQISDALTTAFENGESAVKAYKNVVNSILQEVTQKMLSIGIIEPMLERLRSKLFGYVDSNGNKVNGLFDENDPTSSMSKVTSYIAEYFGSGGEGEKTITAARQFLTGMERLANSKGLSLHNDDVNTLSASVQGTSEETSGLLAGYVNALRQDVSANRLLLMQIAGTDLPDLKAMMTSGNSSLASIDSNVKAIVRMMEQGDGALYREIEAINDRLERFAYGHDKISIR